MVSILGIVGKSALKLRLQHYLPQKLGSFFFSFLFFLIDKVKILLIRVPHRVHWGCTMGPQIRNQNYNDQEKQEGKNKKNEERPHSTQRECARKKT